MDIDRGVENREFRKATRAVRSLPSRQSRRAIPQKVKSNVWSNHSRSFLKFFARPIPSLQIQHTSNAAVHITTRATECILVLVLFTASWMFLICCSDCLLKAKICAIFETPRKWQEGKRDALEDGQLESRQPLIARSSSRLIGQDDRTLLCSIHPQKQRPESL